MSKRLREVLADRIATEMDRRGWSQADLIRASGVNKGVVSLVLARKRWPSESTLDAIADAFGLTSDSLLCMSGEYVYQLAVWLDEMPVHIRNAAVDFIAKLSGTIPPPIA